MFRSLKRIIKALQPKTNDAIFPSELTDFFSAQSGGKTRTALKIVIRRDTPLRTKQNGALVSRAPPNACANL